MNETITADHAGLGDAGSWAESSERYELRDELARGGGGRILIARDRKLDRIVAVKLPLESSGSAARLMREAHLVARLEHPSIVPVHDYGCDEDGRPFYVMKLLGGTTLHARFDDRSFDERIALLPIVAAVADAIAYAHSRGVIHRDLKPSNVLVGEFGEVAVIDWGLARQIGDCDELAGAPEAGDLALARGSRLTLAGAIVGTPAYMPPEQARAEVVDARGDVYALGAILYHLLAGRIPYPASGTAAAIDRLLAGPPDELAAVEPRVPPDLAAIVGKAMARDVAARYRDARELAEDLRRYQAGRLVLAHRYSPWLRVRRAIRRHRAAAAAALVAVAAAAAVIAAWPEAGRDARAMCAATARAVHAAWSPPSRAAVMQRIVATGADGAAGVARQVADRLDRYAAALAAARVDACEDTYVRGARTTALYDERFACFDRRGQDLAATVHLFDRIPAGKLDALSRATRALPDLASCSDEAYLRDGALPADRAARDRVFALQQQVAEARALDRSSQFPAALDAAARIVADPAVSAFKPLLAEARHAQARALAHLGDQPAAEAALLAAIADADASRADAIRAQAMQELAIVYLELERPDDAERVLRALEAVAARVGSKYLEAGRRSGLSRVASARGDHAAAAEHARRALETWQATGDPDLDTLSDFHAALGKAYAIAQRMADAEPHFRTALELSERVLGPDHDQVGIGLGNLANILQARKRSHDAIPLYRRALDILTRTRGNVHAIVLGTRHNLAGALTAIRDLDGALGEYLSLLPAVESQAPDGELCGKLLHNIGLNRKDAGDDTTAERYFRRSLAHAERTHHDHLVAQALWGIGSLQLRAGHPRDALPLLERALAIDGAQLGPTTEAVSQIQLALGRAHLALGRSALAAAHLDAALPYYADHGPPDDLAALHRDLERARAH